MNSQFYKVTNSKDVCQTCNYSLTNIFFKDRLLYKTVLFGGGNLQVYAS